MSKMANAMAMPPQAMILIGLIPNSARRTFRPRSLCLARWMN